jgi:hypothetical protein
MPKRPPPPRPLEGRTDSPTFAGRIRTPQQPAGGPPAGMMRGLDALVPGVGTMVGAAMRPNVMKRRGGRR